MKNYIIILLCLSLLLCGCQAAGNNAGTEPTVAPTAAPTEEPTQEPTAAPTEPPLPAGPIDVEIFLAARASDFEYERIPGRRCDLSGLLHSQDQILQFLSERLGEGYALEQGDELDLTLYDEAFFENNSIVIIITYIIGMPIPHYYFTDGIFRAEDGSYQGLVTMKEGPANTVVANCASIGFLVMKGVTDDAVVKLQLKKHDTIFEVTS